MLLIFGLFAAIWFAAWLSFTPFRAVALIWGLIYVAVMMLHILLPWGHPLREATGGSAGPWAIVGGMAAVAYGYTMLLARIRDRAEAVQAENTPAPSRRAPFSDEELERYARHITLREIGGAGQRKFKQAKVLVVGAGGLGSPVLLYLAAAGIGRIGVIDHDRVDLSNLQRQVIHRDQGQGEPKVFSAMKAMLALNPQIEVLPYHRELTAEIAEELFSEYDLIVDGSDSFATRALVNEAAVATGKPLVAGAISAWEGQVTVYDPANGAPCMACVFPEAPRPEMAQTCSETGVIGALPGMIGGLMAGEVLKIISDAGEPLRGRMLIHDMLYGEHREIALKRKPDCAVCGHI